MRHCSRSTSSEEPGSPPQRTADLIADCEVVVVEQVGSGAVDVLLARRIMPFMLAGAVEEALLTLQDSRRFRYLRQSVNA